MSEYSLVKRTPGSGIDGAKFRLEVYYKNMILFDITVMS